MVTDFDFFDSLNPPYAAKSYGGFAVLKAPRPAGRRAPVMYCLAPGGAAGTLARSFLAREAVPVWVRVDLTASFLGSGRGISFSSSLSGTGWMFQSWFSPKTSCQIWAWVPLSTRIPTRSMTLSARTLRILNRPLSAGTSCQRCPLPEVTDHW